MADALLHAELLAACSALGYSDGVKYHKEADCLETTKDLVRYLRKDDESHEIRRALGETRVVQTDLIPIVRDHSQDAELFDVTLRLLVNLTNPALLLFREELPEEKVTRQQFLHLITQQQGYKEAFVEEQVWSVLVGKLGELLQLSWESRQEEDRLIIERILILVRNILSVPASPEDEKRTEDDASIHDQVLWALHLAGFEDLLLYIASSENEQELCMHSLEIISLMLREQDPSQLAKAGLQRSQTEKEKDEQELIEMRRREALKKQQQRNKYYGARHSRFGGTYYVQNMKSISDRDLISHRALTDIKSINFDHAKKPKKLPKNRADMVDQSCTIRRSTLAIRLFLQEFCIEFLNGAYNSIMYTVKDNLDRAKSQEHDESYYMWALKFFMEFNRHHEFKVELISETLSMQTLHFIQTHLENYFEMMGTDKKKIPLWSRRMHKALRAYQEILMTLAFMDKSPVEEVRESSRVLKSKIFYVNEYRELALTLLQNYDRRKMSITYLKDLIETAHIFLKLLDAFCGKSRHVVVQKKKIVNPKKKSKSAKNEVSQPTEEQLQVIWDEMSAELSAAVQGEAGDLPETIPFDALSEEPEDLQKESAMRKINALLRRKEMLEAVSLLRSARDVWPEGDIFGAQNITPAEEFLSLREIYMANLNPVEAPVETDEEEDEEAAAETYLDLREEDFDLPSFVRRFAHTKVMQAYARLIQRYATNSTHTNHCILKMFHRIAWDSKLPAMFFQASLFCVFREALHDPRQKTNDSIKEIAKFGKYIIRQFFKTLETNPKVFTELLFWKTNKEALEIMCGYEDSGVGKEAAKRAWSEEEEEELKRLHEEFKEKSMEGLESKDCVDLILDNLINQKRTRRGVIKKLKELGLIRDTRDLSNRKTINVRAPRTWTEEEEGELRMLFEDNKDAVDIVGRIMDHMVLRRPKARVIEKILELGLVADKKDLRKKRPKKTSGRRDTSDLGARFVPPGEESDEERGRRRWSDDDSDEDIVDDWSDDEPATTTQQAPKQATCVAPAVTPGLIAKALNTVMEANMQGPVEWLAGFLKDVADDREEDGDFEPVPIVAVTEMCMDAMEDNNFQEMMKLIGLQPPLNHQEQFWRVPSRLSVEALRKRIHYLQQSASGTGIDIPAVDEPLEPVEEVVKNTVFANPVEKTPKPKKQSGHSSKAVSKSKHLAKPRKGQGRSFDIENVDPEDKENYPDDAVANSGSHLSESALRSDTDSSDDDIPLSKQLPSSSSRKRVGSGSDSDSNMSIGRAKSSKKKRRLVVNDDDSDDDSPPVESQDLNLHIDTENTEVDKRVIRRLSSDDEDESPPSTVRQRPKAIVESDED